MQSGRGGAGSTSLKMSWRPCLTGPRVIVPRGARHSGPPDIVDRLDSTSVHCARVPNTAANAGRWAISSCDLGRLRFIVENGRRQSRIGNAEIEALDLANPHCLA